jgi:hypothetical protein
VVEAGAGGVSVTTRKVHQSKIARQVCEIVHLHAGRLGLKKMTDRAGVDYGVVAGWRLKGNDPKLSDAEAMLNECGLTLVFMPLDDPPR